jgi:hypothetical protein
MSALNAWEEADDYDFPDYDDPPHDDPSRGRTRDGGEQRPRPRMASPSVIRAHDLMRKRYSPVKYVVPGYVIEGLTIFAGAPKLGKSWAVLDWAVAVAGGGLAFGSVPCRQGDVLYLALEDNERRLQSRLRHMGLTEAPERLSFATEWPSLDEGCIDYLVDWLNQAQAPRLIAIDVFAKIRSNGTGRESLYELDYKPAAALQTLASRHGIAIVLVHHTRKQDAEDPFDAVSGTRGLTGAADSVLVLRREAGSHNPTLYGRGRDLEEIETVVEFNRETGLWRIVGDAALLTKTGERQEIVDQLTRADAPMGPTELAAALGKSRSVVNHLLLRLFENSQVLRHPGGKYSAAQEMVSEQVHTVHSVHLLPFPEREEREKAAP